MKKFSQYSFKPFLASLVFASFGTIAVNADAATVDAFLKIDSVLGESSDINHKDWIDINSFAMGVLNFNGSNAAIPTFYWKQQIDSSVALLSAGLANGNVYNSATLEIQKSGAVPQPYFQMQFDNVLLTALTTNGGANSANVAGAFVYSQVTMTYWDQKASPPIEGGWIIKDKTSTFFGSPGVIDGLVLAQQASTVPVPAAVGLFASGLVGLIEVARRNAC